MRVCSPVVSGLQYYTGLTQTRLTRTLEASLNTKWTYPLFIQPAIVFVCLPVSSVNQDPIDLNPSVLVFRLT